MIRLIGVLTGAALAIGLLLLLLGVPELAGPRVTDDEPAPDSIATVPAPQAPPAVPAEPVSETPTIEEPESSAGTETMAETEPETEPAAEPGLTTPDGPGPEAQTALAVDDAPAENWYAFWSPFRSRIAADGFVSELSRTTGLDYRVVKLKPGVYEVAVAYTDDADIEDKLTRISAATGLDMSGG